MPNYCDNLLTLSHPDSEMISRAQQALEQGQFLSEFIPVPTALLNTTPDMAEDNINKYGYKDWYDFCIAEWGTKWDVGGDDCYVSLLDNGSIEASFQSAWAPPVDAYRKLEHLGFTVSGHYHEQGMAFCGHYYNGTDNYYEYGDMTPDEIEQHVPANINELFAISENIRQWQQEEDEE